MKKSQIFVIVFVLLLILNVHVVFSYEDFTDGSWIEVDSGNYLTVTASKITWTDILTQTNSYVYKNKTTEMSFTYFLDFKLTSMSYGTGSDNLICLWTVRESYGRMQTGVYGIAVYVDNYPLFENRWRLEITNLKGSPWKYDFSIELTTGTAYYLIIERNVNVFTVYIYDDPTRSSNVDIITIDVTGSPEENYVFSYIQVAASYQGSGGDMISSGYLENFGTTSTISVDLENVDGSGADWVFTNWRYYTFNVTVPETGLSNVSMRFTIPTSFEDVCCVFFTDGSDWIYSSNMSYETRYGEPVLLRAGSWVNGTDSTHVSFLIWFQEHVLDVWENSAAIPVEISVDGASWETVSGGAFRIYSRGGFAMNTAFTNSAYAYILPGGTPFSFHVHDDGTTTHWIYNEIWFRDVQHLKLLPEIHFITGRDAFDIQYGVDYSFGDGFWRTGWSFDINPHTVHYNGLFAAEVWINMSVNFFERTTMLSTENLYMYPHGSITGLGSPGWWEMWVDLWVSDKNASSVGAGRVNGYEYAMEDDADLWVRWLNNNWGVMEISQEGAYAYKEFQGECSILAADGTTIRSSESVVMWRFWSKLTVFSTSEFPTQTIEIRNFENFDVTRCPALPLTGISSPVFDETITPVVGQKGLLGALWSMFSGIGYFLSENVLFGGLNLWGNFVNFLDSIAGLFGQPKFFTNLFKWIGDFFGYLGTGITWIGTVLTSMFTLFVALLGQFLTQMVNIINSFVTTLDYFGDMMGGAYGVGTDMWSDLGISQWIMVFIVFYPIYLIIVWDQEGMDAVISQLKFMFGILAWIGQFLIQLAQFIIRMITAVIESIPVVE